MRGGISLDQKWCAKTTSRWELKMGIENLFSGRMTQMQIAEPHLNSLELKKRMSRAFLVSAFMTSARHPHEVTDYHVDYHGMSSYVSLHMHVSNHIDRVQEKNISSRSKLHELLCC